MSMTAETSPAAQPNSPAASPSPAPQAQALAASEATAPAAAAGTPANPPQATPPAADPQAAPQGQQAAPAQAAGEASSEQPASEEVPEIRITLPEGVEVHQGMLESYTNYAKQAGLTPEQAQSAADWFMQQNAVQQQEYKKSGEMYLKQAWGPKFSENMHTAQQAIATMDKILGHRISAQLVNTGLADAPVMAEVFHFIGQALPEQSMAGATPAMGAAPPMDPEEFVRTVINKQK